MSYQIKGPNRPAPALPLRSSSNVSDRYYAVFSLQNDGHGWGQEFGDYDRECAAEEMADMKYADKALPRMERRKFRMVKVRAADGRNVTQADCDAARKALNDADGIVPPAPAPELAALTEATPEDYAVLGIVSGRSVDGSVFYCGGLSWGSHSSMALRLPLRAAQRVAAALEAREAQTRTPDSGIYRITAREV